MKHDWNISYEAIGRFLKGPLWHAIDEHPFRALKQRAEEDNALKCASLEASQWIYDRILRGSLKWHLQLRQWNIHQEIYKTCLHRIVWSFYRFIHKKICIQCNLCHSQDNLFMSSLIQYVVRMELIEFNTFYLCLSRVSTWIRRIWQRAERGRMIRMNKMHTLIQMWLDYTLV